MKKLILSFVIVFLVAFIGSLFTSPNTDTDWYNSIKPSITPPNYVFPIVWTILFVLIAISLYLVWNKKKRNKYIFLGYGLNFGLNIMWSISYFGFKNILLAFFDLILLWISIAWLIYINYKIDKKASYLLVPYLLWVLFAGILNYLSL